MTQPNSSCLPCTEKSSYCFGGSFLFPKTGYYLPSNSSKVIPCLINSACFGIDPYLKDDPDKSKLETLKGSEFCHPGHHGLLCHGCKPGFGKSDFLGICENCAENFRINLMRILFIFFFFMMYMIYLSHNFTRLSLEVLDADFSFTSLALKIYMGHIQMISLIYQLKNNLNLDASSLVVKLPEYLAIFSYNIFAHDCLIQEIVDASSIKRVLVSSFTLPIIFMCILVFFWVMFSLLFGERDFEAKKKRTERRVIISILIIFHTFYIVIVQTAFNVFECFIVEINSNFSKRVLKMDPNFECWTGEHMQLILLFALPALLICGFLYPFLVYFFLKKYHSSKVIEYRKAINTISNWRNPEKYYQRNPLINLRRYHTNIYLKQRNKMANFQEIQTDFKFSNEIELTISQSPKYNLQSSNLSGSIAIHPSNFSPISHQTNDEFLPENSENSNCLYTFMSKENNINNNPLNGFDIKDSQKKNINEIPNFNSREVMNPLNSFRFNPLNTIHSIHLHSVLKSLSIKKTDRKFQDTNFIKDKEIETMLLKSFRKSIRVSRSLKISPENIKKEEIIQHEKSVKALKSNIEKNKMFTFFYHAYKPECYFWELLVILRQLLFIMILTLLRLYEIKYICMLVILTAFCYATMKNNPFKNNLLNKLEVSSYIIQILSLLCLFFLDSEISSNKNGVYSLLFILILSNFGFAAVLFAILGKKITNQIRESIKESEDLAKSKKIKIREEGDEEFVNKEKGIIVFTE